MTNEQSPTGIRIQLKDDIYRRIFYLSKNAVFLMSPDGTILDCNETATALFGYPRCDMLSMCIDELVPPQISHTVFSLLTRHDIAEGISRWLSGKKKDGAVFPMEISVRSATIDDNDYVVLSAGNLTRTAQMEHSAAISLTPYNKLPV